MLAGLPDPRRLTSKSNDLDLVFTRLLRSYKLDDPAPKPQLALPVSAIKSSVLLPPNPSAKASRLADLTTVAFYYLLRPGEYCMPSRRRRTRTVQFRRQDIRLWNGLDLIPHTAPMATLLAATSATLTIDNQKNGQRGSTMHHYARVDDFCPVKALARIVSQLLSLTPEPNAPISLFAVGQHIISADVTASLRQAAARTGLFNQGYHSKRISAHSLRASGAMALKLGGASDSTIKKAGRWSSDTWLTYIHSQIGALSSGLSERMAVEHLFHNVGG